MRERERERVCVRERVLGNGARQLPERVHAHSLHQLAVAVRGIILAALRKVGEREANLATAVVEEPSEVEAVHVPRVRTKRFAEDPLRE